MLTSEEVQKINQVRLLLLSYQHAQLGEDGFPGGKFHEACSEAEVSLHNMLIIAKHWLQVEISDEELNLSGKVKHE